MGSNKEKVGVQIYFEPTELAALKAATMCDISTQAVLIAVRKYIKDAAGESGK